MVGGYPVTGTMKLTSGGSTRSSQVKAYLEVTSDTSSSDGLSVHLSNFDCDSSARMTEALEFSISKTQCSPALVEGCLLAPVLERGTGSKDAEYSELAINFSGKILVSCTDGTEGELGLTISMSGFRSTEEESVRDVEEMEGASSSQGLSLRAFLEQAARSRLQ